MSRALVHLAKKPAPVVGPGEWVVPAFDGV